jgi:hypothetical protein
MKTMKKSLVLAAAIAALTAIAIPSMASANNWGPVGTYHILSSPSSLTITLPSGPGGLSYGTSCSSGPTFAGLVRTPASPLMDLTSTTTNIACTGTGVSTGCTQALDMIGIPLWSVDGTSTTNVKINSVNIQIRHTGGSCTSPILGTVSGQLVGGAWSALNRSLEFSNDTGLTLTGGAGSWPVTVTASEFIKDTTSPFLSL